MLELPGVCLRVVLRLVAASKLLRAKAKLRPRDEKFDVSSAVASVSASLKTAPNPRTVRNFFFDGTGGVWLAVDRTVLGMRVCWELV